MFLTGRYKTETLRKITAAVAAILLVAILTGIIAAVDYKKRIPEKL